MEGSARRTFTVPFEPARSLRHTPDAPPTATLFETASGSAAAEAAARAATAAADALGSKGALNYLWESVEGGEDVPAPTPEEAAATAHPVPNPFTGSLMVPRAVYSPPSVLDDQVAGFTWLTQRTTAAAWMEHMMYGVSAFRVVHVEVVKNSVPRSVTSSIVRDLLLCHVFVPDPVMGIDFSSAVVTQSPDCPFEDFEWNVPMVHNMTVYNSLVFECCLEAPPDAHCMYYAQHLRCDMAPTACIGDRVPVPLAWMPPQSVLHLRVYVLPRPVLLSAWVTLVEEYKGADNDSWGTYACRVRIPFALSHEEATDVMASSTQAFCQHYFGPGASVLLFPDIQTLEHHPETPSVPALEPVAVQEVKTWLPVATTELRLHYNALSVDTGCVCGLNPRAMYLHHMYYITGRVTVPPVYHACLRCAATVRATDPPLPPTVCDVLKQRGGVSAVRNPAAASGTGDDDAQGLPPEETGAEGGGDSDGDVMDAQGE